MLVIDGKYNTDDGLSTVAMINGKIEDKSKKIEWSKETLESTTVKMAGSECALMDKLEQCRLRRN